MIKFKVCPKCQGDLYLREDIFGKYLSCMQCGYFKDLEAPQPTAAPSPIIDEEEARTAA